MKEFILTSVLATLIGFVGGFILEESITNEPQKSVVTIELRLTELEQHTDALAQQIVQMKADNEANDKYVYDVIKGIKERK